MRKYADYHTHSTFSDGCQTREEMAQAALDGGLYAIGFTDHAPMPFKKNYAIKDVWLPDSIAEAERLKKLYEGRLEIFAGLELDVNLDFDTTGLDYILESNHFVMLGDEFIPTDWTAKHITDAADKYLGGDIFKFFAKYYEELSRAGDRGPCTIAHYDVVSKNNEGECMFREDDPRYLDSALSCLEVLAKKDVLFEVNTGAIFRGLRTKPYPSLPILKRMKELGCRLILGGDAHCKEALGNNFDDAMEYIALAGYKEVEKYPILRK